MHRRPVHVLNLVYSHRFIIRDTRVIESQPYHRLPYMFLRKKKAVRLPVVRVQTANVEAFKLT
eukprot:SAG31_NODE_7516_length_1666_cov_5.846203_2_plen_63_part_00